MNHKPENAKRPAPWLMICCSALVLQMAWMDIKGISPMFMGVGCVASLLILAILNLMAELSAKSEGAMVGGRILVLSSFLATICIAAMRPGLYGSFVAVRGSLDQLAARVDRGEKLKLPMQVGVFTIIAAERRYGNYIALDLYGDSGGPTSLVKSREVPGNDLAHKLTDDWLLYHEDKPFK